VERIPQRNRVVVQKGSLYEGGPTELRPAEETRRRYRELLENKPKPVFREPLTPAQRLAENNRYAALVREEAWREKAQRREERAWQRLQYQGRTVIPTQLEASRRPQGTEPGPVGSFAGGDDGVESSKEAALKGIHKLNLAPETQVMFEKILRSC